MERQALKISRWGDNVYTKIPVTNTRRESSLDLICRLARKGAKLNVRWRATDALSVVSKAEYSVDGCDWLLTSPTTKLSDSRELDYDLTLDNIPAGEHTIAVRVQDEYDNQSADKIVVRQ